MKILFYIGAITLFVSCAKELDDIKLNDNPYDKNYEGPALVAKIDSITSYKNTSTGNTTNYIYVSISYNANRCDLYINGNFYYSQYANGNSKIQFYYSSLSGLLNSYYVKLSSINGLITTQSETYFYVTP